MIELAARSTEGVTIPSRKSARVQIMKHFNDDMVALSKRLNVRCFIAILIDVDTNTSGWFQSERVKGLVSETADAWQAGNTDSYFAVTAHWVEEDESGGWDLKNAIIGFTRLNHSHHGRRLGQALFKVNERLGITARVSSLH